MGIYIHEVRAFDITINLELNSNSLFEIRLIEVNSYHQNICWSQNIAYKYTKTIEKSATCAGTRVFLKIPQFIWQPLSAPFREMQRMERENTSSTLTSARYTWSTTYRPISIWDAMTIIMKHSLRPRIIQTLRATLSVPCRVNKFTSFSEIFNYSFMHIGDLGY